MSLLKKASTGAEKNLASSRYQERMNIMHVYLHIYCLMLRNEIYKIKKNRMGSKQKNTLKT